ncbi:mraZ [Horticoccus luteus]|uniref:Transcriptional regulator MraZ n=2 Tax=Horticoccus luteus TaxID=2862869 RepID=A0A8F9TV11_9BACT|nr:mraZ [Horticoccus luteus]
MGHFGAVTAPTPMSQSVSPLYTGLFRHTLDDKNRLTIPSAWRFAHGADDAFLATPHPDGYIAVLPPAEVEKLRAKIAALALSDGAGQDFVARFFAQTLSLWFDKQGRMSVSAELLQHAGISKDAVLVGSLTKFNIYEPSRWQKVEARTSGENFGDIMRRLGI